MEHALVYDHYGGDIHHHKCRHADGICGTTRIPYESLVRTTTGEWGSVCRSLRRDVAGYRGGGTLVSRLDGQQQREGEGNNNSSSGKKTYQTQNERATQRAGWWGRGFNVARFRQGHGLFVIRVWNM